MVWKMGFCNAAEQTEHTKAAVNRQELVKNGKFSMSLDISGFF